MEKSSDFNGDRNNNNKIHKLPSTGSDDRLIVAVALSSRY
jgi:hypothetical protein